MRISVIGPLGLPATSGGVTRHSEELYCRLAASGHEITLYARSSHTAKSTSYCGVNVVSMTVPRVRGVETVTYSFRASRAASRDTADVVHQQGIASSTFLDLAGKAPRVLTVHSVDFLHSKWPRPIRMLLRAQEGRAVRGARSVICVSEYLSQGIRDRYHLAQVHTIPNGVTPLGEASTSILEELDLTAREFSLVVGRLVPEKGIDLVIDAFRGGEFGRLVVVGTGRYSEAYEAQLRSRSDKHVIFAGERTSGQLRALYENARLFVAPSKVEGFNLTMLEAMAYGAPVLASDIPAHLEFGTSAECLFESASSSALESRLRYLVPNEGALESLRAKGKEIAAKYSWDDIAQRTERVLLDAAAK